MSLSKGNIPKYERVCNAFRQYYTAHGASYDNTFSGFCDDSMSNKLSSV